MYGSSMDASTRQTGIVDRLRRDGRVDVAELSDELGTSEVTIRRDLDQLAESGVLQRVHGGAVSLLMRGDELPVRDARGGGVRGEGADRCRGRGAVA